MKINISLLTTKTTLSSSSLHTLCGHSPNATCNMHMQGKADLL